MSSSSRPWMSIKDGGKRAGAFQVARKMAAAQLSKAPLISAAGVEGRRVPAECDAWPRGLPPPCSAEQPWGRATKAFFQVLLLFMLHVFPAAFKDAELDLGFGGGTCAFMAFAREGCLACSSEVPRGSITGVQPSPIIADTLNFLKVFSCCTRAMD